ncbi:bifunctional lytic transglycosylase/C40 family peptidase [Cytobacillus kochii]|uniref:bifunctional lytic transglycosylase/C40 family peptidase n=1 Tax=Cytobacillus kochii TaxID=859143 RepID=UPI001CD6DCF9|nr:bifunctional lytic transglycosylase/C40 family peptidase [Cytobacillus kochii]MCA1028840.1 bifunctional lysozyme/C40 family peptidase [Cytobacillus kochii]
MKIIIEFLKRGIAAKLLALLFSTTGLYILLGLFVTLIIVGAVSNINNHNSNWDDSNMSPINISPEVERYRSKVEEEAFKNDIPEAVDILLAIMMQESGGRVPDVMQASESQGLPPNSITDPYLSIEIGVAYFAIGFKHAREKASKNANETALQGYNYGFGFISWSIGHEGGWTHDNAIEFARIKSNGTKRENGQWRYGDQNYVQNVMRYLVANDGSNGGGIEPLPGGHATIEKAIAEGSKYIGRSTYVFGGGRNQRDIDRGYFDCSSFIHYAFKMAGLTLGNLTSVTTDTLVKMGKKVSVSEVKRGDLVFFDTYKINGHVGIYLGNGRFLNCQSNGGVRVASMQSGYWADTFNGVIVRVTE